MSDVSPISHDQLQARRKTLRRRRRLSLGQSLWRWVAMAGLTGAVFWGVTRPVWLINRLAATNGSAMRRCKP
jgi:cell division protein FtsQ